MAFNSTPNLPDSWCSLPIASNSSVSTSGYYQLTLSVCVVISLLAPMAVAGNALTLAAIWKNASFRTPSYILLAALALTDFCTGLLTQPFYVVYRLGDLLRNIHMFCIGGVIAKSSGCYFSPLTVMTMAIIAVERWLHMSRRSLLTMRRVVILYITSAVLLIVVVACYMCIVFYTDVIRSPFIVIFIFNAAIFFSVTVFAYYKVCRIIRHHQNQVQSNENAIDIQKYKKSVFTILYILSISIFTELRSPCVLYCCREHYGTWK